MNQSFDGSYDFSALSIKDLLDARDIYHFHLTSKKNVIGTAIGRYLVRDGDPDDGEKPKNPPPRKFSNSSVKRYSWPAIIVLVEKWLDISEFREGGAAKPGDLVPSALFLPDGRAVPVCVVYAPPMHRPTDSKPMVWPNSTFGPGLPLGVTVQGQDRFATIGALVSDGHATYAVTARHACGDNGVNISAILRDGPHHIGQTVGRQLTRLPFSEVYPAFVARQTYLGLDVGLVRLDDINDWTSNVYGLPPLKPMMDIYEQNFSLRLIGEPVVAMGAASGLLQGNIAAFFYRYRSSGGFDYVSDFLIASATDSEGVRQGDSGAMWHLEMRDKNGKFEKKKPVNERNYRPIAILWGAQSFADGDAQSSFSTATTLSNVCKLLDVELVIEGSKALSGTWGPVGHYSIGAISIDLVPKDGLRDILERHRELIGVDLALLKKNEGITKDVAGLSPDGFMPLSDVADTIWRQMPLAKGGVQGGRAVRRTPTGTEGPESANHHCDVDVPYLNGDSFLEECLRDPELIHPAVWRGFFRGGKTAIDKNKRDFDSGILPFRVWQIFEEMKNSAAKDSERFLTAAGLLAHYIGDACQPLHGSDRHGGDKDKTSTVGLSYFGKGVHSKFESGFIAKAAKHGFLFPEIELQLEKLPSIGRVGDGREAAIATLVLIQQAANTLPVDVILSAYESTGLYKSEKKIVIEEMWEAVGTPTATCMALGIRCLAMLWDSAWVAGKGKLGGSKKIKDLDRAKMKSLYEDPDFLRSYTIDEIGVALGLEHVA